MRESEAAFEQIIKISKKHKMDLIDACLYFCEKNEIDPESLINEILEPNLVEIIKYDAAKNNRIRKAVFSLSTNLFEYAK